MDYGVHLPVIDFGFERFSLERLCAYVRKAEELGFKGVSTNDHLIYSRPWLDAPTALAAVLAHTSKMAVGTSVALPVVRGPVQVAKALAAIDILSNDRLFGDQEKKLSDDFASRDFTRNNRDGGVCAQVRLGRAGRLGWKRGQAAG